MRTAGVLPFGGDRTRDQSSAMRSWTTTDIALITFTGSPEVGWGIKQRAPRKHVGLEFGNNAPVVIAEDGDWKKAADKIKIAGFSHAGQSCISTQRIFVHEQPCRRVH